MGPFELTPNGELIITDSKAGCVQLTADQAGDLLAWLYERRDSIYAGNETTERPPWLSLLDHAEPIGLRCPYCLTDGERWYDVGLLDEVFNAYRCFGKVRHTYFVRKAGAI